jgi:hypothetical protein
MKLPKSARASVQRLAAEAGIELPGGAADRVAGRPGALPGVPAGEAVSGPGRAWELRPATEHGSARFVITLADFRPVLTNQLLSVHWARRSKLKRSDAEIIGQACWAAGVTRAAGKRRVSATLLVPKGGRRPDPDSPQKSLLDALAARHGCGALRDDGPAWCEVAPLAYAVSEGGGWGLRLVIEDVAMAKVSKSGRTRRS